MLKKVNFAFVVFLPGLIMAIDIPDVIKMPETIETKDANSLAAQHAKQLEKLNIQQEIEREKFYKKQAQEKNAIFVKSQATTGTLNNATVATLKNNLDAYGKKASEQEDDLQKKHDAQLSNLKNKQQKQIADSKSWTSKISNLFSKDNTVEDDSTQPSSLPNSPKEKTWSDSFNDALGRSNGYKDEALKVVSASPEKFATDPTFLKATLENLTRKEQSEVLNSWLKVYQTKARNLKDAISVTAIKSLFDNLNTLLPENERVTFYDKEFKYEVSTTALLNGSEKVANVGIAITKTIPLLEKSTAELINKFKYVPKAIGDISTQENEMFLLPNNKSSLINNLKNYNTLDRDTILNNWIKFWQETYNHGDEYIEKNIFGKVKQSSVNDANQKKTFVAIKFMTAVENMLGNVNEILPKTQMLTLTDTRGKQVNIIDLFHFLHEAKGKTNQSNFNYLKEFNPSNFKFKIVSI